MLEPETTMIFLYIFGAFVLFIGFWMAQRQSRLRGLRRERQGKGFGREQFIEAFRQLGIPDNIPAAVYEYYGSQNAWKAFAFCPDDRYSEVLHDDPDDLDDDASALVQRLGMLLLPEHVRREYGDKPIKTLRDMVLWLDWMRQHQPAAAKASGSSPERA